MHDGMPYGWNQSQGHSREVDRQSPTGQIFIIIIIVLVLFSHCHAADTVRDSVSSNMRWRALVVVATVLCNRRLRTRVQ